MSATTSRAERARDARTCITCSDEALPMRVLEVERDSGLALCCGPDGERMRVEIALVEPVCTGELLLVHAGTALGRTGTGGSLAR